MDGHQQPIESSLSQDSFFPWFCNNGATEDDIVGAGYVDSSPTGATYDDPSGVPFQGTYYPYTYHLGFNDLGANDPGMGYSDIIPPSTFYHHHDLVYTHDIGFNYLYGEPTYTDPSTNYHRDAGFTSVSHANVNTNMNKTSIDWL
ncbi:hypothetical protein F4815DRAFT_449725 [Daldinia loculata]|nr:hypothetical protein F4815DRAFT_449725 [Daldinia loculata]